MHNSNASHLAARFIRANTNEAQIAGQNVRFWVHRREAIGVANRMTTTAQEQHQVVSIKDYGWLIKNIVAKKVYDAEGLLSNNVVQALHIKFH